MTSPFPPPCPRMGEGVGFFAISAPKHLPFPQKKDIKAIEGKRGERRRILIGKWRKGKSYERLGHYFGNRGNERHSPKLFQYSSLVILAIPWFLFISFFFFSQQQRYLGEMKDILSKSFLAYILAIALSYKIAFFGFLLFSFFSHDGREGEGGCPEQTKQIMLNKSFFFLPSPPSSPFYIQSKYTDKKSFSHFFAEQQIFSSQNIFPLIEVLCQSLKIIIQNQSVIAPYSPPFLKYKLLQFSLKQEKCFVRITNLLPYLVRRIFIIL